MGIFFMRLSWSDHPDLTIGSLKNTSNAVIPLLKKEELRTFYILGSHFVITLL
jgi:hypothetical protein